VTRLKSTDMPEIAADLDAYDAALAAKTGLNLRGFACGAAQIDKSSFGRRASSCRAAVVPLSCGAGVIDGFCEAVERILAYLGFDAAVTRQSDAAGLDEAYRRPSDLVFFADDHRFIAVNTRRHRVVDNSAATGMGFAWGLHRMAGGVAGKPVLVLGLGPVGQAAVSTLIQLGADVCVFDIDSGRMRQMRGAPIRTATGFDSALKSHRLILDATPAGRILKPEDIHAQTYVSAPGVPHGLGPGALRKIAGRFLHDKLEIGVAVMAALALKRSDG
jgi:3-methylornithyl-N6-L-lysine dehydrogenase